MNKILSLMSLLIIVLVSCTRDADTLMSGNTPGVVSGSTTAARFNVLQSTDAIYLTAKINTNRIYQPMTVKITHWDYNNGHTPMIITGKDSFTIDRNQGMYIQNMRQTGFTYTGKMQVDIYSDSLSRLDYSRTVILTDSLGWTVNWDTTSTSQGGWVGGVNKIVDVLPKHY